MTVWSVTTPYDGWTVAYWRNGGGVLKRQLEELSRIAGITYAFTLKDESAGVVKIPRNAFEIEFVRDACVEWWGQERVPRWGLRDAFQVGVELGAKPYVSSFRMYQRQAAAAIVALGGGLLCDEPGLGKTSVALASSEFLTPPERVRLIVGPPYTRAVWRRELDRLGLLRDENDWCALEGLAADEDPSGRWWFCHYEILEAWKARLLVPGRGSRFKPYSIIADEIHNAANPRALRTKALLAVSAQMKVKIGLTGTPVGNKPAELWALLTFLDGPKSWGSWIEFRERYCSAYRDDYGWRDGEPSNVEELRQRMGGRYIRRTKADVALDLPPMRREAVVVAADETDRLADEERRLILDVLLRRQGHEETLKLINALWKKSSKAKVLTTLELVKKLGDQPVVIFCRERAMCDQLVKKIGPDVALAVHGSHSLGARDAAVAMFQAGHGRVLVATFGALREGVTLTRASNLILHDLDWKPSVLLQTEARVHRIGATDPVMVYWMVLRDSIDDLFLTALKTKADAIERSVQMKEARTAMDEIEDGGVEIDGRDAFARDMEVMLRW